MSVKGHPVRDFFFTDFDPLERHQVPSDLRTKMVDWMIEVTTTFKCSERTFFLSVAIFDHFMVEYEGLVEE